MAIIFFDGLVTVFSPADEAFRSDIILKIYAGKSSFVFPDVLIYVIELILDILYPV